MPPPDRAACRDIHAACKAEAEAEADRLSEEQHGEMAAIIHAASS